MAVSKISLQLYFFNESANASLNRLVGSSQSLVWLRQALFGVTTRNRH
jgi:hypothetical protein